MSSASPSSCNFQQSALSVPAAIKARRSVRHYLPDPVPSELLEQVLDLALEAPSSWNLQDRRLVVVRSSEGKAALVEATGGQPQPQQAPVMIVFLADLAAHKRDCSPIWKTACEHAAWTAEFTMLVQTASVAFQSDLEQRGLLREYAVKDAIISASFLMLAAASFGLATSPMNGWDEQLVKRAVGVGGREDLAVALLVSLGYAATQPRHPGRQQRNLNVFHESM